MGDRPDTWMPLYWGDYFKDTLHLGTLEHGAYLLLIGHYWSTGAPLPDDDAQLANITKLPLVKWKAMRRVLVAFFQPVDGVLRHGRVEKELVLAVERKKKASNAANKRWHGAGNAQAHAQASTGQCSEDARHNSPSPESVTSTSTEGGRKTRASARAPTQVPEDFAEAARKPMARSLPDDWQPTPDDLAWAAKMRPDLDATEIERQTARFGLHQRANYRMSHDWSQSWRGWLLNAHASSRVNGESYEERRLREGREKIAELAARGVI